jgi:hypothetical protein
MNNEWRKKMGLINFSHPISGDDSSVVGLTGINYEVVDIPVQLNLEHKFQPQIERLVDAAVQAAGNNIRNIDLIRLPGFADAAVMVVNEFQARGYLPGIIRFARVGDAVPPRFEAVEIMRLKRSQEVFGDEGY